MGKCADCRRTNISGGLCDERVAVVGHVGMTVSTDAADDAPRVNIHSGGNVWFPWVGGVVIVAVEVDDDEIIAEQRYTTSDSEHCQ